MGQNSPKRLRVQLPSHKGLVMGMGAGVKFVSISERTGEFVGFSGTSLEPQSPSFPLFFSHLPSPPPSSNAGDQTLGLIHFGKVLYY